MLAWSIGRGMDPRVVHTTVPIGLAAPPRGFKVGKEGLGRDPDDGLEVLVVIITHQKAVQDGEARPLLGGGRR